MEDDDPTRTYAGGSICCIYVLSLIAMSAIELAGFAEAVSILVAAEAGMVHICGSMYSDQVAFGIGMLVVVGVSVLSSPRAAHVVGSVFFAILLLGYLASFVGM
jgi:hypothetical protein